MRKTKDGMNESRLKCCHQLVKYFDTKVIVAKSVQLRSQINKLQIKVTVQLFSAFFWI